MPESFLAGPSSSELGRLRMPGPSLAGYVCELLLFALCRYGWWSWRESNPPVRRQFGADVLVKALRWVGRAVPGHKEDTPAWPRDGASSRDGGRSDARIGGVTASE